MSRVLVVRPRAKLDVDDAYAWYEEQRVGLGDELLLEIDTTLEAILQRPMSFPEVESNVRRALVKRFPYGVYFVVEDAQIVVFAIYHAKRDPRGWQSRI
jgi:plasmid stabilization system protein ParE